MRPLAVSGTHQDTQLSIARSIAVVYLENHDVIIKIIIDRMNEVMAPRAYRSLSLSSHALTVCLKMGKKRKKVVLCDLCEKAKHPAISAAKLGHESCLITALVWGPAPFALTAPPLHNNAKGRGCQTITAHRPYSHYVMYDVITSVRLYCGAKKQIYECSARRD